MVRLLVLLPLVVACNSTQGSSTARSPAQTGAPEALDLAHPQATPPHSESAARYPGTRRDAVTDVLHGVRIDDPYRWLEDATKPEVQAWLREQTVFGRAYLDGLHSGPGRQALHARLTELYYFDWLSPPFHEGRRWFFYRRHKDKEKSVFYYRDAKRGPDKVLIDPNLLSEDGSVALRGASVSLNGRYVAYRLSQNNSDEATLYVRDLETGVDLPRDVILGAKYAWASWTPDNKGFYYTWLPEAASTTAESTKAESTKAPSTAAPSPAAVPTSSALSVADRPGKAEIRYHKLGQNPAEDAIIVGATNDPTAFISAGVSRDGHWLVVFWSKGTKSTDVWLKDLRKPTQPSKENAGPSPFERANLVPLIVGRDAHYRVEVWQDQLYVMTDEGALRFRIYRVDPKHLAREEWREIVPEHPTATLESMSIVGGHLITTWLDDVLSRVEVRSLDGALVREVPLPGIGAASGPGGRPDEDEAYYSFQSFTQPLQVFNTSVKSGKSELWNELKFPVDLEQMSSEQIFYTSKDGTRIPMFLVHRKDMERNADNPTLLSGYGGFMIAQRPYFSVDHALWLEHGGVVALPNLRGGGEYGEAWHKAGMLDKKQNVFDDFIAAAEWLLENKVTRPERLAISGGSNGGLLVGAAMTQRPELFRAVVCGAPLLDMLRYHLFGSGKTWITEYGSADDPEQFRFLNAYSPYQRIRAGTRYPALLMMSADSDDRVDPMHARKFVAKIQAADAGNGPAVLRIETNSGHVGGDLVKKAVDASVDRFLFLFEQLGMK